MIAVIGATGKTGCRIVHRLESTGTPHRPLSRSTAVRFDWDDPATWPDALEGVHAAYVSYHPDLAFPGAVESVTALAGLARDHGVRHLTLLSGRGEEAAEAAERAVQTSGIASWTIVRCSWFDQNFSESFFREPVRSGVIAIPAGGAVEAFVDAEDIADVAVASLTRPGHSGELYELSGPRLLGFADVAHELGEAIGREVRYEPVTPAQYAVMLQAEGLPMDFVDLFTSILDGRNASVTDGVGRALGRDATDFADYARRAAASGVWEVSPVARVEVG